MITAPNLSCKNCLQIWRENDHELLPACKQDCGCPIESLCDDYTEHFIERFLIAKSLAKASGMPDLQKKIFEELGLFDDEIFHLQLEVLYMKGDALRRENESHGNVVRT